MNVDLLLCSLRHLSFVSMLHQQELVLHIYVPEWADLKLKVIWAWLLSVNTLKRLSVDFVRPWIQGQP